MHFETFLQQRLSAGGFTTEDALASFLPLLRQAAAAHAEGMVAPLEGLAALRVEGVQIWFEESQIRQPRTNARRLRELERGERSALDVIDEARVTEDVDGESSTFENLRVGRRGEEITRPVYLPGYVSWEHAIEHQDPISDVFSLGLILASLACGLDLSDEEQLNQFVRHRRNLFRLNPDVHPVLARAATRMTELNRHSRPQDLTSLLRALDNYRDQEIDFELDLARTPGFGRKTRDEKQQVVLAKLQQRLFEISRRNRLLHFRPTMQTVNLTHASVPLALDVRSIRPEQILVWGNRLHKDVAAGKSISLNQYLNFREAVYLPSVLDRIRAEAQRDQNEYGFAQLRLVACFLRWADLKQSPPEQYESPLVLIPVELVKKKGVRDTYWLNPLSSIAEVNPVVRHLFQQLYAIDLPESVDLESSSLNDLHAHLSSLITASEPAVALEKIDRPRIDLVHGKARRRLDQYRQRVRLSGRGVRNFLDLDYSYDPANYHPLGIELFRSRIRPAQTQLQAIIDSRPRPPQYAVAPAEPATVEKEQSFYHVREHGDGNPFAWEFDLCSVTLGNFKYRKMSLVRDYATLLEENRPNPAFTATFSLTPKPLDAGPAAALPLQERFHVVPCDPTQTAAIAEARSGNSYIIQGPPGTGKSQTITNLIADYVACGKRVLFVCEKRAAIDVVYHRLRQKGLDQLCCLIHDSQADKKEFVQDLKRTYESFLSDAKADDGKAESRRDGILQAVQRELQPLERFDAAMRAAPPPAGVPVRRLLDRLVELRQQLPDVSAREQERIPHFATWSANAEGLQRLHESLRAIQGDGILARHSLRWLRTAIKDQERPIDFVSEHLRKATALLAQIVSPLRNISLPEECTTTLDGVAAITRYAADAEFLARCNLMALLDKESQAAREFQKQVRRCARLEKSLREKQEAAQGWRVKLSVQEAEAALHQARAFQQDPFRWLKPGWWRLRSVLRGSYDFRYHRIKPTWVQILQWLDDEYKGIAALREGETEVCRQQGIEDSPGEFARRVRELMKSLESRPDFVREAHAHLLNSDAVDRDVLALARLDAEVQRLRDQLDRFLHDYDSLTLDGLERTLEEIGDALDELPEYVECLRELAELPEDVASGLRAWPWTLPQFEAAAARRSYDEILRGDRPAAQFNGDVYQRQVERLDRAVQKWQDVNARLICDRVCRRFREHVAVSTSPAAQLSAVQKDLKKRYARGRRELEHEFGKSMRYKPIRELAAGDTGLVLQDLKPVWLMSPLSVSDTLPLDEGSFDVVIFDEASQIPLEEAVPPLFRAKQTIVVGDEMQLPPTNFFSARRAEDEELLTFEQEGELVEYDLESNSFLNHAARNLPSRMLGWHYRSRSESLISFSNWAFYQGRLLTVPEESLAGRGRPELTAADSAAAAGNLRESLARPVSFHFLHHGVYEKRRNRAEAEYIAELVRGLLRQEPRPSIGIVAFSEAQQSEIESALDRLAADDREFREELEQEYEREEEDQFLGLLVKNLENIQGDERDVIILSVCYGHGPEGRMRMNFGPINQSGGEKRLNVAFSRARHHMALVSSIRSSDITNDYNDGAACLKNYLQYAESCSIGDMTAAQRILQSMSLARDMQATAQAEPDATVAQLAAALCVRGYLVDRAVGQSHFRCDLAVRRGDEDRYRLGILIDTDGYYRQPDILERDLMRPKLLRAFGWKVAVVLTKDWWEQPDEVVARLVRLVEGDESEHSSEPFPEDPGENEAPAAPGLAEQSAEPPEHGVADGGRVGVASTSSRPAERSVTSSSFQPIVENRPALDRYFECVAGTSSKFWEIAVNGTMQTVRFGRIGSSGQMQTREFPTADAASLDAERQIAKKLAKGYEERSRRGDGATPP